jgi:hypothetical protein
MLAELEYILLDDRRIRISVDKVLDLPLLQDQRMMYLGFDL